MKRSHVEGGVLLLLMVSLMMLPMNLKAQETKQSSPFDVGGDLVSSYLWRGTKFGTGLVNH